MRAWLESIAGPEYASALMWTVFALIGLLVLLILIRIVRGLTFGTFVAGGRNRKARLAVMDATAVDSHRRLVLVRRDDVEHLILIGGPTDVVVEQNIRLLAPPKRAAADEKPEAPSAMAERPVPVAAPAPMPPRQPAPGPAPLPVPPRRPTPPAVAVPPRPAPAPEPRFSTMPPVTPPAMPPVSVSSPSPVTPPPARPAPVAAPVAPPQPNLDDALLEELEVSLERDHKRPPPQPRTGDSTLDDEMSRLLGDLTAKR